MSDETSEAVAAYREAVRTFDAVIQRVTGDAWAAPTPCTDWDVRQLVNHVVAENLWAPPLLAGRTVDDVAGEIPEDALGTDPLTAWVSASRAALSATDDPGLAGRTMRLSGREASAAHYLMEMAADHAIHAWDLSAALGAPATIDVGLVSTIAGWFAPQADLWRQAGVIGPAVPTDPGTDPQTALLAAFGRAAGWTAG
ncbi:MAG TPA: TIGR03086 family metal-binding protein [Mycobacteriales bacterium]|nr:TIGR03086 family metal-binding protein [Mycobacteriales bacterium]